MPRPSARTLALRLSFSLVVTLLFFALLEGVSRLLPRDLTERRELVVQDYQGLQGTVGKDIMVASEDVPGWDLRTPSGQFGQTPYEANHWRMRGPEYPDEKADDVVRIIFVGDSSVFGYRLTWDETFSAAVERLRESQFPGKDYQVANCAAPGHSTFQSYLKLTRQCLAFQPDLVVIANQYSDSTQEVMPDKEKFHLAAWSPAGQMVQKLAFYRLLRNLYLRRVNASGQDIDAWVIPQVGAPETAQGDFSRVSLDDYYQNLKMMIAAVRDAGAKPALMVLPALADVRHDDRLPSKQYRKVMRGVAEEEGVLLIDAPARFSQLPELDGMFFDPVHPGPTGARFLAQAIVDALGADPP